MTSSIIDGYKFIQAPTMEALHFGKKRTRPNLEVPEQQYKVALTELFLNSPPILDMRAKVGPKLASTVKQVSPGHLLAIHKAWPTLIDCGCANLVLQSKKILSALHQLVAENRILIPADMQEVQVPCLIHCVKDHLMKCAEMMRALKNEGWQYNSDQIAKPYRLSAGMKSKLMHCHRKVLGPILEVMEFSAFVELDPGTLSPMSSRHQEWAMLPPSKVPDGVCHTPSKKPNLDKQITPDKKLFCHGADKDQAVEKDDAQDETVKAVDAGQVDAGQVDSGQVDAGQVDALHVDAQGYPVIFGNFLCAHDGGESVDALQLDAQGYPVIFGNFLCAHDGGESDAKEEPSKMDGNDEDQSLANIAPINPNVRSRKLANIGVAKMRQEEGLEATVTKRVKGKQTTKKKSLKAKMIALWHPEQAPAQAKAKKGGKKEVVK